MIMLARRLAVVAAACLLPGLLVYDSASVAFTSNASELNDDESTASKEPESKAEQTPAEKPNPLDEQLLQELDEDLLNDLEDDLFEGLDAPPKPRDAAPDAAREIDDDLLRELDSEPEALDESGDPLSRIGRQMRRVEERIAESRADETTRTMQQEIVAELDKLLERARQQQQSQSASSQQSPSSRSRRERVQQPDSQQTASRESKQSAQDSTDRQGQADPQKPDPAKMQKLLDELWGHLPKHDRERVRNSTMDQFLPLYEQLIEQYFRRLASEFRNQP